MNAYWMETKSEFLALLRTPRYSVPTLALPAMFYVLFGVLFQQGHLTATLSRLLVVGYGVFGALAASLWGLAVTLAGERSQGWLEVKRASPMPLAAYFVAKIASAITFSLLILGLLAALSVTLAGVRFEAAAWAGLVAVVVVGALPFCAMGLVVGLLTTVNSTPAVVNLISLPMAFCAGLWIPVDFLPPVVQRISPWLPAYHVAQIGRTIIGRPGAWPVAWHVLALAGFTALFLAAAVVLWRRQERLAG